MNRSSAMNPRERLVFHVQELERVELLKKEAAACLRDSFDAAKRDGYDPGTLKVVLKLRRMTADQRRERRALEAIYLAALGLLDGDALPDEARRRLDPQPPQPPAPQTESPSPKSDRPDEETTPPQVAAPLPPQAPLILKTPDEARAEGAAAADAGLRVYDNPYPAGDPCRAAWDEGWCAQRNSHGMDTPTAYQRKSAKPPESHDKPADHDEKDKKPGEGDGADKKEAA